MPEHALRGMAVVADYETYACDQCGGQVKFSGRTHLSIPPKHENVCAGCGRVYVLDKPYPATTFYVPAAKGASRMTISHPTTPPSPALRVPRRMVSRCGTPYDYWESAPSAVPDN